MSNTLSDRIWYALSYAKDMPEKDLPEYANMVAENWQEELKDWIDEHKIMIEKDQWYLDVKEVERGIT